MSEQLDQVVDTLSHRKKGRLSPGVSILDKQIDRRWSERLLLEARIAFYDEKVKEADLKHLECIRKWPSIVAGELKIELATHSAINDLIKNISTGEPQSGLLYWGDAGRGWTSYGGFASAAEFQSTIESAHCFLVQHDWAKLFAEASDFDIGGDWRLPFDICIFDFQVNRGSRVLVLAKQDQDSAISFQISFRFGQSWFVDDGFFQLDRDQIKPESATLSPLAQKLCSHIRAICITLDSEVTEYHLVRVPEKLASARDRSGKPPLRPHNVVSLSRRARAAPTTVADIESGRRVRLHFRRGHWRRFDGHKTWIRWTLVGNPDLGFVDKDYRL
jgi:hypothetical protein